MAKNKEQNIDELVDEEISFEEEIIEEGEKKPSGSSGEDFFAKNQNYILGAVAIIALILVGYFYFFGSNETKNTEANEAMVWAVQNFERDSLSIAINGNGQNLGFSNIVEDYDGTDAGNLAKFYLGLSYLKLGQFDLAIDALEAYSKGDDMIGSSAYAALGVAYEEQNEFENAAKNYEKAASTPGHNEGTTPMYLMDAARAYESAGNKEKALKAYKEIKDKYPLSEEGLTIDKYIARISG